MTTSQRIAVFGSWREPEEQGRFDTVTGSAREWSRDLSRPAFEQACRGLGRAIASAGHQLFIASDSPSTIDYHIVAGVIEDEANYDGTQRPLIVVRNGARRSSKGEENCSRIHEVAIREHPHLFQDPLSLTDKTDWEEVHDYIASGADKVVVVGGGASSYRIAVRALANGKFVVPIGTFGGAGRELIQMLENVRDQRNFPRYEYRTTLAARDWGMNQLETCLYAVATTRVVIRAWTRSICATKPGPQVGGVLRSARRAELDRWFG
jgi:hypothetical protein